MARGCAPHDRWQTTRHSCATHPTSLRCPSTSALSSSSTSLHLMPPRAPQRLPCARKLRVVLRCGGGYLTTARGGQERTQRWRGGQATAPERKRGVTSRREGSPTRERVLSLLLHYCALRVNLMANLQPGCLPHSHTHTHTLASAAECGVDLVTHVLRVAEPFSHGASTCASPPSSLPPHVQNEKPRKR